MKTRIIEDTISPAKSVRFRMLPYVAVGSRFFLTGLLILALSWSLVIPFSVRAERGNNAPGTISISSGSQSTETFTVYGPQRFTRNSGSPVNVVENFSIPVAAAALLSRF